MATNKSDKSNRSVLSQLQSVGEDALGRLAKSPATRTALTSALQLKDRAGKTLSGLEGVETRLDAIEKRLAALEGKAKKTTRALDDAEDGFEACRGEDAGGRACLDRDAADFLARRAQPQAARHDLEPRRSRACDLPVELERDRLGRIDRDVARAHHLDLVVADVTAVVELR